MLVYATPDQYAEWLGLDAPPPGAAQALRAASTEVGSLLLTARYATDEDGYPSDPEQRQASADATCALAAAARTDGDTTGDGAGPWSSVAIGSAQLTRRSPGTPGSSTSTTPGLARAYAILQLAGLVPGVPGVC
ncbi:hypothetical protein [Stackebrandtia soli]|uniref:hypothetical protein n=1 Tax=Stackebrandtia soli TaxID=1892856 RepID=UPI0039E8278A